MSSISIAAHLNIVGAIVRTYESDLDKMRRELQLAENDRHLLNIENNRHLLNIRRQLNMKSFEANVFFLTTLIGLFSTFFWVTKFYMHYASEVDMRRFLTCLLS